MSSIRNRTLTCALEQFRLPNGLQVIFHRDPSTPLVAVNLWYHVGSKDERPGLTGLAHLFEHLMFEGSTNHDDDYFRPLQEAGASVNGSTSNDRTQYHAVVPTNFLELALWMEAERMANLLPALSEEKLANQKSVVLNERKQRYENQPYGRVGEELCRILYPADHPYAWPVIGWTADIEAASLGDVRDFFRTHYHPANATLCLVGDFDADEARLLVEKHFAGIPSGPMPKKALAGPPAVASRMRIPDRVALSRLDLVWHTGPRFSADEAALDVAAEILAGRSKDSRLKRRLLLEEKLVRSIGAGNDTLMLAGRWHLRCHALPGIELPRIEAIVLEEIDGLIRNPPTAEEVERVQRDFEHQMYSRVETALGKSHAFCHRQLFRGQVEDDAIVRELEEYLAVRSEDVIRVVREYLKRPHSAIEVVPGEVAGKSIAAADPPPANKHRSGKKIVLPGGKSEPRVRLPNVEWIKLECGLQLAIARMDRLPRVDFDLLFPLGSVADPAEFLGISRLTAELLDEGTVGRDAVQLARALDRIGTRVGISNGLESTGISMQALADRVPESIELLGEIIFQPRFDADDLSREKTRLLSELAHRERDPDWLAEDAFDRLIYGDDHPYGRSPDGTPDSLARIDTKRVVAFHRANFDLAGATLIVVGCCEPSEISDLLNRALADSMLPLTPRKERNTLQPPSPPPDRLRIINRPDSPQSVLRVGCPSVARNTPDYFALLVLNTILGGQFVSRLNANLREHKGYTYGARSAFNLRKQSGAFVASADVQASATVDAVREIVSEITDLSGNRPVSLAELEYAKTYLARRFPARFETVGGIGNAIAQISMFDLPRDFFASYLDRLAAVTLEDVHRTARTYLDPSTLKVAISGDSKYAAGVENLF